jgi:hypothetical protein
MGRSEPRAGTVNLHRGDEERFIGKQKTSKVQRKRNPRTPLIVNFYHRLQILKHAARSLNGSGVGCEKNQSGLI